METIGRVEGSICSKKIPRRRIVALIAIYGSHTFKASRQGGAAEPILEALSLGARPVCQRSQGRTGHSIHKTAKVKGVT